MSILLQDSISRSLLPIPHNTDKPVSFYACGITPYSDAHIGHARSFVVFDLMKTVMEKGGYQVNIVRNITDIDDKIIAAAASQNRNWKEFAHSFAHKNRQLMGQLNVHNYEEPSASEHIQEIIDFVQRLIDKGYAYIGENGDVLFSVSSFKGVALMPHDLDDLGYNGSRVQHDGKRDNRDFILWKGAKPNEPSWVSPWGEGRPGWHIECSAMIEKRFGETLDYHGGGTDLRFPHHQAEIQQSEAAYDRPLASRWVHHGSVRDGNGQKMSKSLGNVVLLKDALSDAEELAPGGGGAIVRHALLTSLWTKPLDWSNKMLQTSFIYLKNWSKYAQEGVVLNEQNQLLVDNLLNVLNNNINTPLFFASLHKYAQEAKMGSVDYAYALYEGLLLLGITQEQIIVFKELADPIQKEIPENIQQLITLRDRYRADKNFEQADFIRDKLKDLGWNLQDSTIKNKIKM